MIGIIIFAIISLNLMCAYFQLRSIKTDGGYFSFSRPSRSGGWRRWAFEVDRSGVRILGLNFMESPLRHSYDGRRDVMTIEGKHYTGAFFRFMAKPDPGRLFRFVEDGSGRLNIEEITNSDPQMPLLHLDRDATRRFLESHGVLTVNNIKGKHNRDLNNAIRGNKAINRF